MHNKTIFAGSWYPDYDDVDIFKIKAEELVTAILPAFQTTTGIPYPMINPYKNIVYFDNDSWGISRLEDFGGIHLEMCYLSEITNNSLYCELAVSIL